VYFMYGIVGVMYVWDSGCTINKYGIVGVLYVWDSGCTRCMG
jgi:hypothetical protein